MPLSGILQEGAIPRENGIAILSRGGGDDAVGGVAVKIAG
jgi:hypothetical protein